MDKILATEVAISDVQCYSLRIDGDLLRNQRRILLKLVNAAHENVLNAPQAQHDTGLLEGILALLDEIADQAHDQYGIDCLLEDQPEEQQSEPIDSGPQRA